MLQVARTIASSYLQVARYREIIDSAMMNAKQPRKIRNKVLPKQTDRIIAELDSENRTVNVSK
jgi:hypothetical protein